MKNFTITVEPDGLAEVRFDVPGRKMNTFTAEAVAELTAVVDRIRTDEAIKSVLIQSAKSGNFCAGADLDDLLDDIGRPLGDDQAARVERLGVMGAALRALETCGKPVAVALEGLALGGGLELALAAHFRVAADDEKIQLGLPEVTIGLLPGAGGTQRLPRLTGIAAGLPLLLEGKSVGAAKARAMGIIDALAPQGEAADVARIWLRSGDASATARWDRKDFTVPGGGPSSPAANQAIAMALATTRKATAGNYPAPLAILKCVYEGLQVPIDAGLRIELRHFVSTLATPQARAMARSLFISPQALAKGAARPEASAFAPVKVGVLGAGMMGAGIAYVQARAGIDTVLVDVSQDAAERGKNYSRRLLDKALKRGTLDQGTTDAVLDRIEPTTDFAALAGCDLVIEAVFEDRAVKADVVQRAEAHLATGTLMASNTSTLPITGLATASRSPERFIGLHFFSPVDRMKLVEVIVGKRTDDLTLAHALDYVRKIGKTPIVVNDSRGFYTSRCFATYVYEGVEMLMEGIPAIIIENAGRMSGMPRGPLELFDDVALDLDVKIRAQTQADLGDDYDRPGMADLVDVMVTEHDRQGRKNGKGFYDYPDGAAKTLWPGLAHLAPALRSGEDPQALLAEARQRLLYRQALEAARCIDEQVLTDPRSADVGAILGWGFAPWTGGPLSLIDMIGARHFVDDCDALATRVGSRFAPPNSLRQMVEEGRSFYE